MENQNGSAEGSKALVASDVLAKSATEIQTMLGGLEPAMIGELKKLEEEMDKPRANVLKALKAEMEARAGELTEALKLAADAAKAAGVKVLVGDEVDTLEKRVTDMEAKLDKVNKPKATPSKKGPGKERTMKLDKKAEQVPAALAFADEDGKTSKLLPDLEFRASQFDRREDRRGGSDEVASVLTLNAEITFPQGTTPFDVSEVYVLNSAGKAFGVCKLISPLRVGGGNGAMFPPGHLVFQCAPQPAD